MTRLDQMIEKIEAGEPVDLRQVSRLLALDCARDDERFVAEFIDRQRQADEKLLTIL